MCHGGSKRDEGSPRQQMRRGVRDSSIRAAMSCSLELPQVVKNELEVLLDAVCSRNGQP